MIYTEASCLSKNGEINQWTRGAYCAILKIVFGMDGNTGMTNKLGVRRTG